MKKLIILLYRFLYNFVDRSGLQTLTIEGDRNERYINHRGYKIASAKN